MSTRSRPSAHRAARPDLPPQPAPVRRLATRVVRANDRFARRFERWLDRLAGAGAALPAPRSAPAARRPVPVQAARARQWVLIGVHVAGYVLIVALLLVGMPRFAATAWIALAGALAIVSLIVDAAAIRHIQDERRLFAAVLAEDGSTDDRPRGERVGEGMVLAYLLLHAGCAALFALVLGVPAILLALFGYL
ncbi:MAG: hypothetical protein JNK11_11205 [Alphaproteobacteria bacterium]|nr:hypothetical protein [Alphaproteobacteria bacterium]